MRLSKLLCSVLFVAVIALVASNALAGASPKIGVIDLREVLAKSEAGKAAAQRIEDKMKTLKGKFTSEQNHLRALQEEIKKKSSAWSDDKRAAKVRELQKADRNLKEKRSDASFEVKQLEEKEIGPILKTLGQILQDYGKANGYTVILNKMAGVAYASDSVDVSSSVIKELNKKMSGK